MPCQIIDTGKGSAESNMAIDYDLLHQLSPLSDPFLHLYDWEGDCASYGYFFDPFQVLDERVVAKQQLNLISRPTGGGMLFHLSDFTFSLFIPASHPAYSVNTMQNYAFVNRFIGNVIEKFTNKKANLMHSPLECSHDGFVCCMAAPVQYDVMVLNKKIAGGAQRRTKQGLLHQGSVLLTDLNYALLSDLFKDSTLLQQMKKNSCSLAEVLETTTDLNKIRNDFKNLLCKEIHSIL